MDNPVGFVVGRKFIWSDSNPCMGCSREMYKPGNRVDGKVRYHAKGLCSGCYTRDRLDLPYIGPKDYFDDDGQTCTRCSIYQPYDQYIEHKKNRSGHATWCRTCQKMYKFNITKLDFDRLLEECNGLCSICLKPPTEGGKSLVVDHDHTCCPGQYSCGKCIRGILCDNCNKGIGLLQDDMTLVLTAYNYLKERQLGEGNN